MEQNMWATGRRIMLDKTTGRSVFLGKGDDGSYKIEFTNLHDGVVFQRTSVRISEAAMGALMQLYQELDIPEAEVDRVPDGDKKVMFFTVVNNEWHKAEPPKDDDK